MNSILNWLVFSDSLSTWFSNRDKLTVYETSLSATQVFEAIRSKDSTLLNGETVAMLLLNELDSSEEDIALGYTYLRWRTFLSNL